MAPRVFLITGTSSGFGSDLVDVVLKNGDHVVATARNSSKLSFKGTNSDNSLLVDLDVTKQESIDKAFSEATKKFKTIDVVVNNAGYGLAGEFESLSEQQIRTQMEVNFFGLTNVTRKAMEHMRESGKGGVIQQVTSIGGQIGITRSYNVQFSAILTPPRRPIILHLLRLQMGRRRLHRSHLQGSKTRMEHQIHMHRARRVPHRLGRPQHGVWREQEQSVRSS
jgi:NAD(P)-dependent dehydrogenase (short-subunit alcohol dehydrogenase family)